MNFNAALELRGCLSVQVYGGNLFLMSSSNKLVCLQLVPTEEAAFITNVSDFADRPLSWERKQKTKHISVCVNHVWFGVEGVLLQFYFKASQLPKDQVWSAKSLNALSLIAIISLLLSCVPLKRVIAYNHVTIWQYTLSEIRKYSLSVDRKWY